MLDITKHTDNMSTSREIQLRRLVSKAYELAEDLEWCNPDENLEIQKRTASKKDSKETQEAVVPIISNKFKKHDSARDAYTELQRVSKQVNIEVYDVHYDEDKKVIGIVLDPFEL